MFEDISKHKVADLKRELKERNLSATGNKQELYDRLKDAVQFGVKGALTVKSPAASNSGSEDEDDLEDGVGDLNSDILPDDEEEELDEDALLNPPINEFPSSTTATTNLLKRKSDQLVSSSSETLTQPKRISLGQHSKISFNDNDTTDKENTNIGSEIATSPTEEKTPAINTERKVIKLSGLSVQERLELRAKKFNVDLPTEAKLEARAERFGLNTGVAKSTADGGKTNTPTTGANSDILKKRAERFGSAAAAITTASADATTVVSSPLSQAELEAKKRARAERFGLNSSSNGTSTTAAVTPAVVEKTSPPAASDAVVDEVLVKRAQRFRIVI